MAKIRKSQSLNIVEILLEKRLFAPVMIMNFYHFLRGLKSHEPSLPKNIEIVVMLDVSQNTSKCRTMCL